MPSHRLAAIGLSAFLTAMFFLQWWQMPSYPLLLWIGLTISIILSLSLSLRLRQSLFVTPALLGIIIALLAVSYSTHVPSPQTIDWYSTGSGVTMIGMIAEPPEQRGVGLRSIIEIRSVRIGKTKDVINVQGRVLVTDPAGWPRYDYGDIVEVSGDLEKPGQIEDFRYDHFLSRSNIYAVMYRGRVRMTGDNDGWTAFRMLYAFRNWIAERVTVLFPEPHAALLLGLLVGGRQGIPEDVQADFKTTGLTHLVAISGYNITLLLTMISLFLCWLPPQYRFLPAVFFIAAFTLLTGATASVVRASVMGVLGLLATQMGRTRLPRLTLLWAASLMLLINPKQLWYDPGFHLSFLALLGVTEISPLLEKPMRFLPEHFGIRDSLRLTVAAQIATIPWSLHLFGSLSVIAPLSNLLAPPVVPIAMASGFLGVLGSALSESFGRLIGVPALLALEWLLFATHFLAALPAAAIQGLTMNTLLTSLSYGALVLWVVLHEWRASTRTSAPSSRSPSLPVPESGAESEMRWRPLPRPAAAHGQTAVPVSP